MKNKDKHISKPTTKNSEQPNQVKAKDEAEKKGFPGYPHYPASEDIYNQEEEVNLDPEDLSKTKKNPEDLGKNNIKTFQEDMTGEDLDVPGSKDDETKANSGKEDEENNYYSLGGDNHNDLEEDKG